MDLSFRFTFPCHLSLPKLTFFVHFHFILQFSSFHSLPVELTESQFIIAFYFILLHDSLFTDVLLQLTVTNGSYFNNVINNRAFSVKAMLQDLRKPVDKGR